MREGCQSSHDGHTCQLSLGHLGMHRWYEHGDGYSHGDRWWDRDPSDRDIRDENIRAAVLQISYALDEMVQMSKGSSGTAGKHMVCFCMDCRGQLERAVGRLAELTGVEESK